MAEPRTIERSEGDAGDRSVLDLAALLLRRLKLLIGLPLLVAASAVAFSFLLPKRYTVESRFVPESNTPNVSRIAGLAAQFGVNLGAGEATESIDFYAELLESQDLLRSAVLSEYVVPTSRDTLRGDLVQLLEVKGDTPAERERAAIEALDELVVTRPDPAANMVAVRTSAPWPALSVQINERLLQLLSEFNVERRQSRAAAERSFLESRQQEAQRDLREAERALERFLSENRRYDESPQLRFEHGRLQRQVDLRQEIYTSLAQGYEQARVDEVRNTPVITVIDQPRGPAEKTAPNIVVNAALGLILGLLLALAIVIGGELMESARRRDPEAYARVRESLRFPRGSSAAR
jgi:uncharacterized protein involved in exopolysaccharide biosynthesis